MKKLERMKSKIASKSIFYLIFVIICFILLSFVPESSDIIYCGNCDKIVTPKDWSCGNCGEIF